MHELRILQGRHRGTSFPLGDMPRLIGQRDQADVRLYDASIAPHHATLWPEGNGWVLTAAEGTIADGAGNDVARSLRITAGQTARLGDVWVGIAATDAAWQPLQSAPVSAAGHFGRFGRVGAFGRIRARLRRFVPTVRLNRKSWNNAVATLPRRGAIAVAMLLVAAACATPLRQRIGAADTGNGANATNMTNAATAPIALAATAAPAAASAEQDGAQLQRDFRDRLQEAGMTKRFELDLEDHAWNMKAVLDDKEMARFGQVLVQFNREHHVPFAIDAKITEASTTLPFKVESVFSGENASVVTQDGKRLFVGDEYHGVRLAAISGKWITFVGKRRIDMIW